MSLSLPGSEGPQNVASPTRSYSLPSFYELFCRERPRNRRGSSQVHITRRRFNMTFPPPSLCPNVPRKEGRRERRTTVAAALMNLKHSRTTFFSPSFPPSLLLFVPFSPPLSLSSMLVHWEFAERSQAGDKMVLSLLSLYACTSGWKPKLRHQTMLWMQMRKATYIPSLLLLPRHVLEALASSIVDRGKKRKERRRGEKGEEEMRVVTGGSECLVNSNWPSPPLEGACRHQFQPRQT